MPQKFEVVGLWAKCTLLTTQALKIYALLSTTGVGSTSYDEQQATHDKRRAGHSIHVQRRLLSGQTEQHTTTPPSNQQTKKTTTTKDQTTTNNTFCRLSEQNNDNLCRHRLKHF